MIVKEDDCNKIDRTQYVWSSAGRSYREKNDDECNNEMKNKTY